MTADEQGPDTDLDELEYHVKAFQASDGAAVCLNLIAALRAARTERDTALAERDGLKCLLESSILKGQGYCGARHWNGGTCFHPAGHPEGHPEHFGDVDRLRTERDTAKELAEHRQRMTVTQGRIAADNLKRALAAEAAVVTARRDAWDEGYQASRVDEDGNSAWETPNPYRARASTQTTPAERGEES